MGTKRKRRAPTEKITWGTKAMANPFEQVTAKQDSRHIARACELHARKLLNAADADRKAGLTENATQATEQAAVISAFGEAVEAASTVEYRADVHRVACEMGLRQLVKNVRMARLTMIGIGEMDMAADLEPIADRIESYLVPMFAEQLTLTPES